MITRAAYGNPEGVSTVAVFYQSEKVLLVPCTVAFLLSLLKCWHPLWFYHHLPLPFTLPGAHRWNVWLAVWPLSQSLPLYPILQTRKLRHSAVKLQVQRQTTCKEWLSREQDHNHNSIHSFNSHNYGLRCFVLFFNFSFYRWHLSLPAKCQRELKSKCADLFYPLSDPSSIAFPKLKSESLSSC